MTTNILQNVPQNLELSVDSPDKFDVREFAVEEGVNTLFSIELLVRCDNPAVDFEQTVGAQASFRVGLDANLMPDAPSPSWNGVVQNIEQVTSEDTGLSTYRIRLAPALWLLTQRTNCQVFQQMTDLDVVLTMFKEWGLPHESACTESYKPKKYRVQYQETDFAFVRDRKSVV